MREITNDKLGLKQSNWMTISPNKAGNRRYLPTSALEFVIQLRLTEIGAKYKTTLQDRKTQPPVAGRSTTQ